MRFQNVIHALFTEPWAITSSGWDKAFNVAKPHLTGQLPAVPQADDGADIYGDPIQKMQFQGSLAIIPIKGTLIQHAGMLEKVCGACSYDDVKADIRAAMDMSGRVESILFDIGSPGGMCVGNQETADLVTDARENGIECYSFTDSEMCSAAYNIAASCEKIFCTKSAFIGSIGTLMAIIDRTEQFKQAGLKLELFASGKFKGAGTPGTELTEEQRNYFRGIRDDFAEMFKDNVRNNREGLLADESAMEGQVFVGVAAVAAGLADSVVEDIEDAIEQID